MKEVTTNYADLLPGDLVFVMGQKWFSRIIKKVTRSPFSHSAIYVGGGAVIEAEALRVVGYESLYTYAGHYEVVRLSDGVGRNALHNGLAWLISQRGRRYSYWTIVRLLFKCLFGFTVGKRDKTNVICSMLAVEFLQNCGVYVPSGDMSPEDLYEWMKTQGKAV